MNVIKKMYDWFGTKVHSPHAYWWLIGLFFIEASFFFVPVDPLLILFCIEDNRRSFFFATIATAASVIGGIFGYVIGSVLWDSIGISLVRWIITEATFQSVVAKYSLYQAWAVFIAGFTPVPYKAVTISAGFCKLPFMPFVVYSVLSRGLRFFLVAGAIRLWGEQIKIVIEKYFNYLVIAFTVLLVLSCSVLKGANMIELSMPEIKKVEGLARSKEGCISFAQGTLRVGGVHKDIKEYARQILLTDKADYYNDALGIETLRKKLADSLSKTHNTKIGLDNVMISHGAIGALMSLCLAKLGLNDEVLLPEPTYPVYKNIVSFCKAKSMFVTAFSMKQDQQGDYRWVLDVEAIKNAITSKTKMLMLSNPSNPLGTSLSKEEFLAVKDLCVRNGIYLVIDEIYDDFIFEGDFYSATPHAVESQYVIRIGSFSKNFGMSGWRCGYLVAQAHVVKSLASVQACFLNCPTIISQYASMYALEHSREILEKNYEKVKKSRDLVCAFFDCMQEQGLFTYVKPTAGFYLFFKTHEADSYELVMNILNKANVAMAPGVGFGPSAKSFVRLCFAREPEVVEQGIKRLQDFFLLQRRTHRVAMMGASL